MRSPPHPFLLLGSACWCFALAGCSYDWNVGPEGLADAGGAAGEAGQDAQSSAECQQIIGELEQARVTLRECIPGGGPETSCMYPVTDECGCNFSVAKVFSYTAYNELVADFQNAECKMQCGPCGPEAIFFKCEDNTDGAPARCVPSS